MLNGWHAAGKPLQQLAAIVMLLHMQGSDAQQSMCTDSVLGKFSGWPAALDSSLYWMGPNDAVEKAGDGTPSNYYDPTKQTVIFFHGWTGNGNEGGGGDTMACKRVTRICPEEVCPGQGHLDLFDRWQSDGWNVGFFYWDQFADEFCARDAEQKIWFDRDGDGLRWKSYDPRTGLFAYNAMPTSAVSVADICVQAIKTSMNGFTGSHVRFVGHNIGAQLSTRCAALLHQENHAAAPQRLTLLEPYFSKSHMYIFRCNKISADSGSIGDFTLTATTGFVKSLWTSKQVVTEIYMSLVLTEMDEFGVPDFDLQQNSVLVKYDPGWCGSIGPLYHTDVAHVTCRHHAIMPNYFMSYGYPAPAALPASPPGLGQTGSAAQHCQTPSARCSDGEIREWYARQLALSGQQAWTQSTGLLTFDLADDTYTIAPGIGVAQTADAIVTMDASSLESVGPQVSLFDRVLKPTVLFPVLLVAVGTVVACVACLSGRCRAQSDMDEEMGSTKPRRKSAVSNKAGQYESLELATSDTGSSRPSSAASLLPQGANVVSYVPRR